MAGKYFTGGNKLQARLKQIANHLNSAARLETGYPEGATTPDGTSLPMIAAIQEFGAPAASIPARPFFRPTVEKHSDEWGDQIAAQLVLTDYSAEQTLIAVGDTVRADLQDTIANIQDPPLSPITVMLRGMRSHDQSLVVGGRTVGEAAGRVAAGKINYGASTKPLVDTGFMLQEVKSTVKK